MSALMKRNLKWYLIIFSLLSLSSCQKVNPNLTSVKFTQAVYQIEYGSTFEFEADNVITDYVGTVTFPVIDTLTLGPATYPIMIDNAGQVSEHLMAVEIIDTTPPVISGVKDIIVQVNDVVDLAENILAMDNVDGALTPTFTPAKIDTSQAGEVKVLVSAQDHSGNGVEASFLVLIKPKPVVVKPAKGVIYLTFDDGPNSSTTPKILAILKQYQVKATFFVTGKGPDAIILQAYQAGHQIALHTWTHNYSQVYSSVDNYYQDLAKIQARVKQITGQTSQLIRFPGGSSNTVSKAYKKGIMSFLTKDVVKRGFVYFDWNVSSGDASNKATSEKIVKNVIKGLNRNGSNIVLMHDTKMMTVEALGEIIKYGKANGYTFKVLTMDSPTAHHRIAN